jgi:REP element-mobilizing transposase RayT
MARLVRVSPTDIPQHIILRCNNRQVCFGNEVDMKAYLHWLKLFSKKYQVGIHAEKGVSTRLSKYRYFWSFSCPVFCP